MKLRENNETDVKIESMVMEYSEVVQRYRVPYIHSECLNELLDLRSHWLVSSKNNFYSLIRQKGSEDPFEQH